ncbi:ethanolamine ammonia-lyase light chain EutC [Sorangium sp. So ce542]|uniref:ethanolamine ammonia-lyase light chain EutC n=1 Tax=Sorangium sp. So ce542 TaxID=3133316 RepID=UPI003F605098
MAERRGARLVVMLLGERPGSGEFASRSLSAYLACRLTPGVAQEAAAAFSDNPAIGFEYRVISNIHAGGLPAAEAGWVLVEKVPQVLARPHGRQPAARVARRRRCVSNARARPAPAIRPRRRHLASRLALSEEWAKRVREETTGPPRSG